MGGRDIITRMEQVNAIENKKAGARHYRFQPSVRHAHAGSTSAADGHGHVWIYLLGTPEGAYHPVGHPQLELREFLHADT